MKQVVLLRGLQSEAKRQLIENNSLGEYVIDFNEIKKMLGILRYGYSRGQIILEEEWHLETSAYKVLEEILSQKMENGICAIIDAPFISLVEIENFDRLAKEFGYEIKVVNFETSFGELQSQNVRRNEEKRLPLWEIEERYIRFVLETPKIKDEFEVLDPKYLADIFNFVLEDYDKYPSLRVIGDIHSSATALEKMINSADENTHFIFLGDYLDRGTDPLKTLYLLNSILDRSEFLYGNHEVYFEKLANIFKKASRNMDVEEIMKMESLSHDATITLKKLYNSSESFEKIHLLMKEIVDRLVYYKYIAYNDKKYFLSHGGISREILSMKNPACLPRCVFMKGVGKYLTDIDSIYEKNNDGTIQMHGHRNKFDIDLESYVYSKNLEGAVESVGALRVVELRQREADKNLYFKEEFLAYEPDSSSNEMQRYFMESKKSKNIMVRPRKVRHIYSFNFRDEIYLPRNWEKVRYKADGIFANINKNEVVARGFNKAFDDYAIAKVGVEERANRIDEVAYAIGSYLKFPLQVSRKYNGYKGYLGYNFEKDELFFASKLGDDTLEADRFEEIFVSIYSKRLLEIKELLRDEEICLLFEVLEPNNISNYLDLSEPAIVLVGVLKRHLEEIVLGKEYTTDLAKRFGFNVVKYLPDIEDYGELREFLKATYSMRSLKGYVLRDESGGLVKVKTSQQLILKQIYIALRRALNDDFESIAYYDDESIEREFLEYICKHLSRIERFDTFKNVIGRARPFFEKRGFIFSDENSFLVDL